MRLTTLKPYLVKKVRKEIEEEWNEEMCDDYIAKSEIKNPSLFIDLKAKKDYIACMERTNIHLSSSENLYKEYARFLSKVRDYVPHNTRTSFRQIYKSPIAKGYTYK